MAAQEPWGAGHVIAGKFRLTHQLGQGGMGSVWAADHLALNSQVAVKIIDPAIASNAEALQRFMREAQAAAALRSPHVVQTFDYGVEDGVPFIAMELLDGVSLATRIEQAGKLTVENTAQILTQVGRAISRAHEAGIVHRDLKPDNIYLVKNDDEEIAKVLDFGIAKATGNALGTSSQTRTGAILGTPYYMSPEQAEGNRSVDHRTDLWSLAIIAFECVTGRRPFESEALGDLILQICVRPIKKPSSVLATLTPEFDAWYDKGTQRDPALRFQSARDLTVALRAAAGLRAGGGDTTAQKQPSITNEAGPQNFGTTPQRPFNATTGGASAVAHTSSAPGRPGTPLIIGATLGALLLAGTVAFIALRGGDHGATGATGAPSADAPLAAQKPSEPAKVAEPEKAAPAPEPAKTVEPAVAPAPEPQAAAPAEPAPAPHPVAAKPAAVGVAKPAKPPPPVSVKKSDKPAASKRVDFGF